MGCGLQLKESDPRLRYSQSPTAGTQAPECLRSRLTVYFLQLFSPLGDFLAKYGFDGQLWKHFDSPRGVSFTADNQVHMVLVQDMYFNTHLVGRGYWLQQPPTSCDQSRLSGSSGETFLLHYQYVVLFLCSRNRFYEVTPQFLGSEGTKDGEFTRPNGVTVDDEGNIIVADSRNDRIQVNFGVSTFQVLRFSSRCSLPVESFSASLAPRGLALASLTDLVG